MFNELNNQVRTIKEGVNLENMEFKKLREFIGSEIKVDGFYITSGGLYGDSCVVIGNGYKINMPKRAVKQFKDIKENQEMLNAVLQGHLKLVDIKTVSTPKGIAVVYNLADC